MAGRDIGEDEAEKRRKEELERRENALREAENHGGARRPLSWKGAKPRREAQLRAAEQAARGQRLGSSRTARGGATRAEAEAARLEQTARDRRRH